jgi:hypothetical protein
MSAQCALLDVKGKRLNAAAHFGSIVFLAACSGPSRLPAVPAALTNQAVV